MVYTIFTRNGSYEFDHLADLLQAAEEMKTWNECTVCYEFNNHQKNYLFFDNGRDIYRSSDGVLLDQMIPRFMLKPI